MKAQFILSLSLAVASCAADRELTVFDRMVEAVNAGDAREYASVYAEDAVISIYGNSRLEGRPAIERYETELLKQFPGARLGLYAVWRRGGKAAARYAVNVRTAEGRVLGHEGLLFYRLDDSGLFATENRYLDSLTPLAQLGALGAAPVRAPPVLPKNTRHYEAVDEPTEQANTALVLASIAAWAAGDRSAFTASVADDVHVDELMFVEPFHGRDGASTWFDTWSAAARDLRVEVVDVLAVGDWVLVELVVRGMPLGSLSGNKEFLFHRAVTAQVRDGKLVHIACFMNGKELAQSVGPGAAPLSIQSR
jgi:ketosteroid isomerase-like protein